MTLYELKAQLDNCEQLSFQYENGEKLAPHFHLTELGRLDKYFIDCGGQVRNQTQLSMQLWHADDLDHRLSAEKFKRIIALSESKLGLPNAEILVEVQGKTIETYALGFAGNTFVLQALHTDCLASDACGLPAKPKIQLAGLTQTVEACCTPGGGCC